MPDNEVAMPAASNAKKSDQIGELAAALAKAQLKFGKVLRDTENPYYRSRYADLSSVIAATQPSLAENGLVIIQSPIVDLDHQRAGIETMMAHSSGQWLSDQLLLPAVMKAKEGGIKFDAQSVGSAITYARRYSYQAFVGVAAEEDDDGNRAAGLGTSEAAQAVAQRKIEAHNASKAQQQASGEASTGEVVGVPKANIPDMPEEAAPNQFGPLTERKLTKTGHLKLRLADGEPLMVWKDQKVRRGGELVHVSEIIKSFLADEQPFCDFEIEKRIPDGNGKPYWAVRGVRQIGSFKWDDDGTEILDVNDERTQSLWPKGDR